MVCKVVDEVFDCYGLVGLKLSEWGSASHSVASKCGGLLSMKEFQTSVLQVGGMEHRRCLACAFTTTESSCCMINKPDSM